MKVHVHVHVGKGIMAPVALKQINTIPSQYWPGSAQATLNSNVRIMCFIYEVLQTIWWKEAIVHTKALKLYATLILNSNFTWNTADVEALHTTWWKDYCAYQDTKLHF